MTLPLHAASIIVCTWLIAKKGMYRSFSAAVYLDVFCCTIHFWPTTMISVICRHLYNVFCHERQSWRAGCSASGHSLTGDCAPDRWSPVSSGIPLQCPQEKGQLPATVEQNSPLQVSCSAPPAMLQLWLVAYYCNSPAVCGGTAQWQAVGSVL